MAQDASEPVVEEVQQAPAPETPSEPAAPTAPETPTEPEATPQPEVIPEATPEPTAEPTGEPQPTVTPEPTPESVRLPVAPASTPEPAAENVPTTPSESPSNEHPLPTFDPTDMLAIPLNLPTFQSEDIVEQESAPVEQECLIDNTQITESLQTDWTINEKEGFATTNENVKLGVKYIFPQENKVSVTFKCLPKDESLRQPLKIQQIKVSELKLPTDIRVDGEYAYDITTEMKNGDFQYDISLPKSENKSVEISYIEKSVEEVKDLTTPLTEEDIQTIDESISQKDHTIEAAGVDHFTIVFVSATMSVFASFNGASQVTVYPGTQIDVSMTVTTSGADSVDNWQRSQYLIEGGAWTCVDTDNNNGDNTYTETITITAPNALGTYDLTLRAYIDNNCTGSFDFINLSDAITVTSANTLPFSESFGTTASPTVANWYETDPAELISSTGDDAPVNGQFAKIGDNGWICRPFNAMTVSSVLLSYDWKGDVDAESSDDGIVEYKVGGSCGDSSGWTNLGTNALDDTSWGNRTHTFAGNSVFNLRFRTNANNANESFRVDNISLTAVPQPDLIVTKTNDVGGNGTLNQAFTWTLTVTNIGTANATFSNEDILQDDLPSSGIAYSPTSNLAVTTAGGVTGSIDCDISSNTLDCDDNNGDAAVVIPPSGSFSVTVTATPSETGTFSNPRNGGICKVDPDTNESESNESNNECPTNAVTVAAIQPVANPALTQACGLDIAFVLDVSGSINATELSQMKTAMTGIVTALAGTPTEFSVTKFDTTASVVQGFTGNTATVNAAINGISGGGSTNWQDGFTKGNTTLPNRSNPNLVIFASDGDPNTTGISPGGTSSPGTAASVAAAVTVANTIKTGGTRILAIGISAAPTIANLQAVSGPNTNTGSFTTSDLVTADFSTLAQQIATFASDTCGRTVTVTKLIDADGNLGTTNDQAPASGWSFDVGGQSGQVTDGNGKTPAVTLAAGSGYSVVETVQNNYTLLSASCSGAANNGTQDLQNNRVTGLQIANGNVVSCTFINTLSSGGLTVVKHVVGSNEPASSWNMMVRETPSSPNAAAFPGSEAGTTVSLSPATYTILETGPADYTVSYAGGCNAQGEVTVVAGTTKTCTLTNTRDTGSLKVTKRVDTDGDGTFETENPASFIWSVDGSGTNAMGSTVAGFSTGAHSISENTVTNYHPVTWYLTADTTQNCSNSTRPLPADVMVNKDQTTEITICNARNTGTITIDKVTNPVGDSTVFDFKRTGDDLQTVNFSLSDATAPISYTIPTGVYSLEEINIPSGWSLSGLSCDQSATINLANHIATFDLDTNEHITCTFTNTKKSSITINKVDTTNSGQDFTFNFTPLGASSTQFVLDDDNDSDASYSDTTTFSNLSSGFYDVNEVVPAGWTASIVECSSNLNLVNYPQYSVWHGTMSIALRVGENLNCTFTNTRDTGEIIVTKLIDIDGDVQTTGDQSPASGWEFDVEGQSTDTNEVLGLLTTASGATSSGMINTGSYNVVETEQDGYDFVTAYCDNESGTEDGATLYGVEVEKDEVVNCTFINTPDGSIHGYKWNDLNGNGERDCVESEENNLEDRIQCELEPLLPDWTIYLYQWNGEGYDSEPLATMKTADGPPHFGWYWFEHLLPGKYRVCEELKAGWTQTFPVDPSCYDVALPDDNSYGFEQELNATDGPVYKFGNQENVGLLQITKANNSYPTTQRPGDTITYTLTLTAKEGPVNSVEMIDVPQDGFDYVTNSWTANSSVRGDIKNAPTTQPTYGSPGTWILGDMVKDEVVTLTYQAKIGSDVTAGTHPDLAYAYGEQPSGTSILAEAQATGYISPEYVGTDVIVALADPDGTLAYEVERKETVTGQVLGASTELPATGMPLTLPLIGFGLFVTGLLTLAAGLFVRRRHALVKATSGLGVALLILIGLVTPASAYNSLSLRVEQLPSPYNQKEFKLRYVVLDIDNRPITIECYQKAPSAGGYSLFSSPTAIQAGGDNHYCNVTSDITGEAGTYQFYVVAYAGDDTFPSPVQAVDLRTNTGPGTPTNYSKDRQSCKDRLTFTAADDSDKTARIEVYRSENKSFTADSGSRIDNFGASSKQNFTKEYDRADCGKTYYYAVRAFDSANNGSGLVGDIETVVTTVTTTTTTTTSPTIVTSALPILGVGGRGIGSILGTADVTEDMVDLNGDGFIDDEELAIAATKSAAIASEAARIRAERAAQATDEAEATQGAVLGTSIKNFFSSIIGFFPWLIGLIIAFFRNLFS